MPKKKKEPSRFKRFLIDFQRKKRVVVLDKVSFEEKRVFNVSKFSLLVFWSLILNYFNINYLEHFFQKKNLKLLNI